MTVHERYIVRQDEDGSRLDRLIRRRNERLSWHRIQHMLRRRIVWVDGMGGSGDTRVRLGQVVTIGAKIHAATTAQQEPLMAADKARELLHGMIVHEDDRMLVLNKPQGMAVQGGSGVGRHHLAHLLRASYGDEAWLVHRLDQKVSGVLLVARDAMMARTLTSLFRNRLMFKVYWGITTAPPPHEHGHMNQAVGKKKSYDAHTVYRLLARLEDNRYLIAFYPVTGRKHQIRIHAAAENMPLLGDDHYGGLRHGSLQLHGRMIAWQGEDDMRHRFVAPLPPVMTSLLHGVAMESHDINAWEEQHYEWLQEMATS